MSYGWEAGPSLYYMGPGTEPRIWSAKECIGKEQCGEPTILIIDGDKGKGARYISAKQLVFLLRKFAEYNGADSIIKELSDA